MGAGVEVSRDRVAVTMQQDVALALGGVDSEPTRLAVGNFFGTTERLWQCQAFTGWSMIAIAAHVQIA